MADLYDLLRLAQADPEAMKKILADKKKYAVFGLTSAQLSAIKKLKANQIKSALLAIDKRISEGPIAGTNACPGASRCIDRPATFQGR